MKAFEDSTGKPLEEEKKELASEELIITRRAKVKNKVLIKQLV